MSLRKRLIHIKMIPASMIHEPAVIFPRSHPKPTPMQKYWARKRKPLIGFIVWLFPFERWIIESIDKDQDSGD